MPLQRKVLSTEKVISNIHDIAVFVN